MKRIQRPIWHNPDVSIYIRPVGGLGNQLFIYAAGRAIAHRTGQELGIRTDWYRRHSDRRYELNSFARQGFELEKFNILDIPFLGNAITAKLFSHAPNWSKKKAYIEKAFYYDKNLPNSIPSSGEFRGYFQSWKYFDEIADEIRSEVTDITEPSSWFLETQKQLRTISPFAAIHLRLTDYVNPELRWLHGWTGQDYYKRAMKILETLVGKLPLVVFTDDLLAAKKLIPAWFPNAKLISPPLNSRPIESLVLMSQASALIASNSTYSWWAGWLGHHNQRPVLVPRPWFAVESMPDWDLVLPEWISIGRDYDCPF